MKDFATYLEGVQTVAIAGHARPDGDCVWQPIIISRIIIRR